MAVGVTVSILENVNYLALKYQKWKMETAIGIGEIRQTRKDLSERPWECAKCHSTTNSRTELFSRSALSQRDKEASPTSHSARYRMSFF